MSAAFRQPVKLAIVGTGLIGPRHAEAVLRDANAELLCIVDPNPAAKAIAGKFGCAYYASIQGMLASTQPDGAIVCTPNNTHVALSKELLKDGVHVLCEKPISADSESGQELIDCAEASGRHLLIGHHRRFNRYVVAAKNALPSLGKIVAVSGLWTIYKPPEYFEPPMEWHRAESAGPVLINLVHDVDILHYWFGPIVRVSAEKTMSQRGHPAEEGAAIILRFANGIVGTFLLSDAVVSPHNFECGTGENPTIPTEGRDAYRIFGSESSLSFPDMMKWTYAGQRSWTGPLACEHVDVPDMKIPFELQVEHFVAVIKGEEAPSCSGIDGLRAVMVCEAVKKSIADGCPVEIPIRS
ncbi:hypothetical protein DPSP01_011236 [Paraphaeosphaeria sporulosa]|uniref:Putative oxidoreductase n=1 Tax=Paraphaeosphaeria sporulosa TaxID=1460663 RepID=A0A177CNN0_9PLEO|nr:putative oxidoreductase [Paraphaeosphaeria sporulosa]OAG08367.1 putative oxidoreductase [Paraphaeosphaeria sporulosa]